MHLLKWLYPGMRFKRWLCLFAVGALLTGLGLAIVFNYKYIDSIEEFLFYAVYTWTGSYDYMITAIVGIAIIVFGLIIMLLATRMVIRSLITVLVPDKSGRLVDMIYEHRKLDKGPNVTVIGGGTGLSVLLRGMKEETRNATAIVTVADDGGSSGRLREEFNIVPPGDLRNCLVALADTSLRRHAPQHVLERPGRADAVALPQGPPQRLLCRADHRLRRVYGERRLRPAGCARSLRAADPPGVYAAARLHDVRRAARVHHHHEQGLPAHGRQHGHPAAAGRRAGHPRQTRTLPGAVPNRAGRHGRLGGGGSVIGN